MKIQDFGKKKKEGVKISMVSCYEAWSAALVADTSVDCILVGDSLSMLVYGYDTTIPADVETMAAHTAAVRRGAPEAFIIGDLPFLSYRSGLGRTMDAVGTLIRAGANAVKLEGSSGNLDLIRHIVQSGIPVMGHVGLTPQSVHGLGGFRVQGRGEKGAEKLIEDALALEAAGCFSIVLEAVPAALAGEITGRLKVPSIGIGAGAEVDGQVLVLHDLLGITSSFRPKFVRTWLDGADLIRSALNAFHTDTCSGEFPSSQESYR